jgi:protein-S-isoprenylcysteine O-methyltransferase Ste14
MWPILVVLYVRLAMKEEADMEAEFGQAYRQYKARTFMFIPLPTFRRHEAPKARTSHLT